MEFLYPNILFALSALAIPIIVHLFNFRKHRLVYFSRIALLKNLVQQTSKTNQLKHLIILMLRLLAIAALVIAFAGPYLTEQKPEKSSDENLIVVYLDNSLSMSLKGSKGSLFDEARQLAADIAGSVNKNDRLLLVTNDMLPKHEYTVTPDEFIRELGGLGLSSRPMPMSTIFERVNQLTIKESGSKSAFLLSDFQKTSADVNNLSPDTLFRHFFVQLKPQSYQNVFIDSCWLDSPVLYPGQSVSLMARVFNEGGEDLKNQTVELISNNTRKAIANVDLNSNSFTDIELQFVADQSGWQNAEVLISDFPVVFDDKMHLSFKVTDKLKILEIFGDSPNRWIQLLASGDPMFVLHSRNNFQLDFQSFSQYRLIVLNEIEQIPDGLAFALDQYIQGGGRVLVIPSPRVAPSGINQWISSFGLSYNIDPDTANTRVFSLQTAHPLFRDVFVSIPDNPDFPYVFKHYPIVPLRRDNTISLMTMANGGAFLAEASHFQGKVYVLPVALDDEWSGFQRNALFVPVVYRLALLQSGTERLYHIPGRESLVEIPFVPENPDHAVKIIAPDSMVWIPQQRNYRGITQFALAAGTDLPGHHRIFSDDSTIGFVSVNHNRIESRLLTWDEEELNSAVVSAGFDSRSTLAPSDIKGKRSEELIRPGSMLWKWFIFMALLFLLIEILLLKFWK
jgi:hypothetical protein